MLLANMTTWQGFDEFMNLVIDDAVEVTQVTKVNDHESRRPLGTKNRAVRLGWRTRRLPCLQARSC